MKRNVVLKESEAQTVHGTGLEDQKINEGKLGGWREKKKRKIEGGGGFKSPWHQCVKPTSLTRWLEDIPFSRWSGPRKWLLDVGGRGGGFYLISMPLARSNVT